MWLSTSVPRTRRDAPKRNRCHAAIHDRSPHTQGWVGLVKFGELIVVPFPALRRSSRLARCRCRPRPRGGSICTFGDTADVTVSAAPAGWLSRLG